MKITELIEKVEKNEVNLELAGTQKMYEDFFESVVWQDIRKVIFELIVKERTVLEFAEGEDYKQKMIASQGALAAYRDILGLSDTLTLINKEGENDDSGEQSS